MQIKFLRTIIVFMFLTLMFSSSYAISKDVQKVFGKTKADKALVYFICMKNHGFSDSSIYIMSSEQYIGALDGDGYTYAYIEPGKHYLWHTRWRFAINEIEFLPGQTYYINISRRQYSLLDEIEGKALVNYVKYYYLVDEDSQKTATRVLKKNLKKAMEHKQKRDMNKVFISEVPPQSEPINSDEYVKIDSCTPIKLDFFENVSSSYSKNGDVVFLRVRDNVIIDNKVCVRKGEFVKGYIREARPAKSTTEGFLDIVIPGVPTVDNQEIPVVGQVFRFGNSGSFKTLGYGSGVLYLSEEGQQAYQLYGQEITVLTRSDSWVNPAEVNNERRIENIDNRNGTVIKGKFVKPRALFESVISGKNQDVKIIFPFEQQIIHLMITTINGYKIPIVIYPKSIEYKDKEFHAIFEGRDFIRFLSVGRKINNIELKGTLPLGQDFYIMVDANITN